MRPLTLHASALTDSEYTLYTTSLCDLAGEDDTSRSHTHDDSYYAALQISVREARAWIRGRYTDLAPPSVDAVLKLFCPNLGVTDVLSGGQFFAALRLITHVRHGKPVDGSLVFVQAHPDDGLPKPATVPTDGENAIPTPTDSRRSSREVPSSDVPEQLVDLSTPVRTPIPAPAPPRPAAASGVPLVPPKPLPGTPAAPSTNPFVNRAKSHDVQPSPAARTRNMPSPLPPLPPRKPAGPPPPPPPRHSSLASPNSTTFPTSGAAPAFAFWHNHSLSSGSTPTNPNVLIQQSLQAGRIAQSLKKAEEKLEKERVMEVLKSSSATSSSARVRTRSESPTKDAFVAPTPITPFTKPRSTSSASGSGSSNSTGPAGRTSSTVTGRGPALPPRRRPSPPPSAISARSFEQVAHATIPVSARSSFSRDGSIERRCSPPPQHPDLIPQPPPTHPDRKPHPPPPPSTAPDTNDDDRISLGGRPQRSKSVHYPQPPPPPPPSRKRRPESVQYGVLAMQNRAPSPSFSDRTSRTSPASIPHRGAGTGGGVSRHLSLSSHSSRRSDSGFPSTSTGPGATVQRDDSPIASIRNTFMGLQPKLEAARYKTEAGFSRRGFIPHRHASLFHEEGEDRLVASEPDSLISTSTGNSDDGGLGQDSTSAVDANGDEKPGSRWNGAGRGVGADGGGGVNMWEARGRSASAGGELRKERLRPWEVERDEMKWPAGEGWKPL